MKEFFDYTKTKLYEEFDFGDEWDIKSNHNLDVLFLHIKSRYKIRVSISSIGLQIIVRVEGQDDGILIWENLCKNEIFIDLGEFEPFLNRLISEERYTASSKITPEYQVESNAEAFDWIDKTIALVVENYN